MSSELERSRSLATSTIPHNGFSLISNEKLRDLYVALLKCRILEERARGLLTKSGRTGRSRATLVLEAVAAGVAIDLLSQDTVSTSTRNLSPCFVKGLPFEMLFAPLLKPATPQPTVAARLRSIASAAVNHKEKRSNNVAVIFLPAKCADRSVCQRAHRLAAERNLPILFVYCGKPSRVPDDSRPRGEENVAVRHEDSSGCPSIPVDGNDVVALYRVATEAIAHARKGNGPTAIECIAFSQTSGDPILLMEAYLTRKSLFSEEWKQDVSAAFSREVEDALPASVRAQPAHALYGPGSL